MDRKKLIQLIREKKSFLCIGLDSDMDKIPGHLLGAEDPVFEFNRQIIEATHDLAVAYKPNLAFYECRGSAGWQSFEKTMAFLATFKEAVFTIADAKRGDIGNTSEQYARAFFDQAGADAVTVAPYMGSDSVKPFLKFEDKWVILLALTSNEGSKDFQFLQLRETGSEPCLYESVIRKSMAWGGPDNMMYVVGATRAEALENIRRIIPEHFLLIPGVGAQGGSLKEVAMHGMNKDCGLLVNSSRNIIFASGEHDFALKAREQALLMQEEMKQVLETRRLI
ncbi:MAG TPA: orotidine-5'-phosphate decarboxylase [Bacteroidales bacterium]|nr:orotidine-5'-phosphate decarboxylase [Bacteroidales bacterium]HSA44135.1 orotidine-5'-phosphate decarboxylase [Bacteroidales bacterium]